MRRKPSRSSPNGTSVCKKLKDQEDDQSRQLVLFRDDSTTDERRTSGRSE